MASNDPQSPLDLKSKIFQKGDVIFSEGESGDVAYIVQSGCVGIFKTVEGERIRLNLLTGGELFGEMAIIDGSRRMAEAVALDRSVVRMIPADILEEKIEQYDAFLKALIKILVGNLRAAHKTYMRRPRDAGDYLDAIAFHSEGLRDVVEMMRGGERYDRSNQNLDNLEAAAAELRKLLVDG